MFCTTATGQAENMDRCVPRDRDRRPGARCRVTTALVALGSLTLAAAGCDSSVTSNGGSQEPTSAAVSAPPVQTVSPRTDVSSTTSAPVTSVPPSDESSGAPTSTPAPPVTNTLMLPGAGSVASMTWPSSAAGWVLADRTDGTRVLMSTTDAGEHWSTVEGPDTDGAGQVLFADATNGWIAGAHGLITTHDGGASWSIADIPGGGPSIAAVAATANIVHVAYVDAGGGTIAIASSPVVADSFVPAAYTIPSGAGPRLDVSMSAGGPYAELVYNDRTLTGAAEIRNGQWDAWDLTCPYANPFATAGLSPGGDTLTIACAPSGFGENAPLVAANLSTGTLAWVTIEPADDSAGGQAEVDVATATDAGVRIVAYTGADGTSTIASSTDGGATWPTRNPLPDGARPTAFAHLPDGRIIVATGPHGGVISADGLTWAPVAPAGP